MPRSRIIQRKFTQGELDPEAISRGDIDQYYGAVSKGLNVFSVPQGGLTLSPGLAYIGKILGSISRATAGVTISTPNGGTGANANDDNTGTELITTTNIGTLNPYVVVHYDLGSAVDIGYVRVRGLKCSTGTVENVYIQTSPDNVVWTNNGDSITLNTTDQTLTRRVHKNVRYVRLARVGAINLASTTVTLDEFEVWIDGAVSEVKLINFEFNTEITYLLVVTEFNIAVYLDNVYQTDIYAPALFESKIGKLQWTQSANTLILVEETLQPQIVTRTSNISWTIEDISFDYIPKYDFNPVTTQPAVNVTPDAISGVVKLTASSSLFVPGDVDQVIEGNGGRARIVKYINGTTVSAYMEIPFFSTDQLNAGTWDFLKGFENVWGGGNGWPRSVTFFEGRLWFGGSQSRPRTLWGSRVGLTFDFNPGTALDDDAVIVDVSGANNELNTIVNLYGGRNLQVFTTGATYAVLRELGQAITPTNIFMPPQTNVGAQDGLRIYGIEGVVYYIQRGGSSVRGHVFSDSVNAYDTSIVSKLSSHLIKNPVSIALRQATSTDEGAYLLLVSDDGNLTVANISNIEGITAFLERTTDGQFVTTGTVFDQMYFAVDRNINGNDVRYLERFDSDNVFDSSIRITTGLPASTFTGLNHLEGETIKVRADDFALDDVTVSNGQVTLPITVSNYVEFGIQYVPIIRDAPVIMQGQGGQASRLGVKKRVSEIHVRVYETTSLNINGNEIDFNKLQSLSSTAATTPYTGVVSVYGNLGWSEDGILEITQTKPGKMQILEISKKVNA